MGIPLSDEQLGKADAWVPAKVVLQEPMSGTLQAENFVTLKEDAPEAISMLSAGM